MIIDLAKQFSPYPSGRFPADGSFNGQRFREEILLPALIAAMPRVGEKVVVDIDGVRSFGSSFLEEAFAGLVRNGSLSRRELEDKLEIVCTKPHLQFFKDSIMTYIRQALPSQASVHA